MLLSLAVLLLLAAFIVTVLSSMGKAPLWVAVLLVVVLLMIQTFPR